MKMRLKYKLIVSYLVVSVVIIVTLLATSFFLLTNQFNAYVKRNMENNMMLLATQINLDLNRNDDVLEQIDWDSYASSALDQGFFLSVKNTEDSILWSMASVHENNSELMLSTLENTMLGFDPDFQGEYIEESFDLIRQNQLVGTLVLGHFGPYHYTSSDASFLTMMGRLFGFGAVGFVLFAIVLGYWMANRLATPIDGVIASTKRIANGNYRELMEEETNTVELNELIGSVNRLAISLDQQLASKRIMAMDYAHEFRTPLAVLRSNLEGMIDGVWEVNEERLQSLHEEIMRLNRMIENIDRLVEVEQEDFVLQKTKVDLTSFVSSVTDVFAGELHDKNLKLELLGDVVETMIDVDKMNQVMINLLSNAIKYNRMDSMDSTIKVQVGEKELIDRTNQANKAIKANKTNINETQEKYQRYAFIQIQDQGIGIAKDDLPFIFEHLYRADKSRQYDVSGSGIGLAIVKSLVEQHGGWIDVESEFGVGSTFTVWLPKGM